MQHCASVINYFVETMTLKILVSLHFFSGLYLCQIAWAVNQIYLWFSSYVGLELTWLIFLFMTHVSRKSMVFKIIVDKDVTRKHM